MNSKQTKLQSFLNKAVAAKASTDNVPDKSGTTAIEYDRRFQKAARAVTNTKYSSMNTSASSYIGHIKP